jgi:hypothetical protein
MAIWADFRNHKSPLPTYPRTSNIPLFSILRKKTIEILGAMVEEPCLKNGIIFFQPISTQFLKVKRGFVDP